MRTPNSAALALRARALAGEKIPKVLLVHFALTVPQRWAVCGIDLPWDGHTWSGRDIAVGDISIEVGSRATLQFTLPAVTSGERALALSDVEGEEVTVYLADVDPTNGEVADAAAVWSGVLDQPGWQDGPLATAIFTANSLEWLAEQPKPSRYTNDEQLRLYPGDTSMDVDPLTDKPQLVWPAASYFRA